MRDVTERITVRGWLVALSPIHVGGLTTETDVDLTLARDGLDRFVVPGTSLAGALRSWLAPEAAMDADREDVLATIWGGMERASRFSIEDGLIFPTLDAALRATDDAGVLRDPCCDPRAGDRIEVRTGVGISRESGTAASGILYSRAVLGAGVAVRCVVTLEIPDVADASAFRAHLEDLVNALVSGDVQLGAAKGAGLGRVQLDAVSTTVERVAMRSRAGVLHRVGTGARPLPLHEFSWETGARIRTRRARTRFEIPWRQLQPVMVRDAIEGIAIDSLPLTTEMVDSGGGVVRRATIPGASIKGALRTHAERIVRTVFVVPDASSEVDKSPRFVDALDQLHLVTALFGRAGQGPDAARDGREHHGRGAITVHDVVGTGSLPQDDWQALLEGESVPTDESNRLSQALRGRLGNAGFHPRTRNAIDRWTSGTANGALFSLLEPREATWDPIVVEVDMTRLVPNEQEPALALLCYVVRDFCAGMIPLGHGTSAGMGSASADENQVMATNVPSLVPDGEEDDVVPTTTFARLRTSPWAAQVASAFNRWHEPYATVAVGDAS